MVCVATVAEACVPRGLERAVVSRLPSPVCLFIHEESSVGVSYRRIVGSSRYLKKERERETSKIGC